MDQRSSKLYRLLSANCAENGNRSSCDDLRPQISVHKKEQRVISSLSPTPNHHLQSVIECGTEDIRNQMDESFRQVMFLNCWGQV